MNPIILPKKLINKDEYYFLEIYEKLSKEFSFKIDNRNVDKIFNSILDINVKKNLYFFFIKLFETNNIENPLSYIDGGIPNNGIEFINRKTYEGLGIYHAHISNIDKSVLIWYFEFTKKEILLKFEYCSPHPEDGYKKNINDIYNNPNSFNISTGEYLSDNKYKLNEYHILNFNNFVKYIK